MSRPDDIHAILARLMPPALSEEASQSIGETIDQLALDSALDLPTVSSARTLWPWLVGAAAAFALAALVLWNTSTTAPTTPTAHTPPPSSDLVRISHTDTLQSLVQEGWRDDPSGTPHQTLRLHMLAQHQILDEQTGIVMTVSEPREEILLVPVHAF